jgi:hypothetical protein
MHVVNSSDAVHPSKMNMTQVPWLQILGKTQETCTNKAKAFSFILKNVDLFLFAHISGKVHLY